MFQLKQLLNNDRNRGCDWTEVATTIIDSEGNSGTVNWNNRTNWNESFWKFYARSLSVIFLIICRCWSFRRLTVSLIIYDLRLKYLVLPRAMPLYNNDTYPMGFPLRKVLFYVDIISKFAPADTKRTTRTKYISSSNFLLILVCQ